MVCVRKAKLNGKASMSISLMISGGIERKVILVLRTPVVVESSESLFGPDFGRFPRLILGIMSEAKQS